MPRAPIACAISSSPGNLTTIAPIRRVFEAMNDSDSFGVRFLTPSNSQFGTVIGAALSE